MMLKQFFQSQYVVKFSRVILVSVFSGASAIGSFLFGMFAAQALTVDDFGKYVYLYSVSGIATILFSFGAPQLIELQVASEKSDSAQTGRFSLFPLFVIQFWALSSLLFICLFLGSSNVTFLVLLVGAASVQNMVVSVLQGQERILVATSITNVLRPILSVTLLLVAIGLSHVSTGHVLLVQLLSSLLCLTVAVFFTFRTQIHLLWNLSGHLWSSLASFRNKLITTAKCSSGFLFLQVLISLTTQIDILLLGYFVEPASVASYFASSRVALLSTFVFGAAVSAVTPQVYRLTASRDATSLANTIRFYSFLGALSTSIGALGIILFSSEILNLFGPHYSDSKTVLIILLTGYCLSTLFGVAQPVLIANRLNSIVLKVTFSSLVLGATVSMLLVQNYGEVGVAFGAAAQMILYFGGQWYFALRKCGLRCDALFFLRG